MSVVRLHPANVVEADLAGFIAKSAATQQIEQLVACLHFLE